MKISLSQKICLFLLSSFVIFCIKVNRVDTINLFGQGALSIVLAIILINIKKFVDSTISKLNINADIKNNFLRYSIYTYAITLLYGLSFFGIHPNIAFATLIILLFIMAQFLLLVLLCAKAGKGENSTIFTADFIPALFLISGVAALVYQVVWQRVLFATFGTNVESVTVIVSIFMFGLGVGAMVGGVIQKKFQSKLLEIFIFIEVAIGLFGLISIPLIQKVGEITPSSSIITLILTTYAILLLPTMLMGATLPVLVAYLQGRVKNIGYNVGKLYAYNTFGSAISSWLTVTLFFVILGRQGTVIFAVFCNFITAFFILLIHRNIKNAKIDNDVIEEKPLNEKPISFNFAFITSLALGFVSLSLEIISFRLVNMITASKAPMFGAMLTIFLLGIGVGSLYAKDQSKKGSIAEFLVRSIVALFIATILMLPVVSIFAKYYPTISISPTIIFIFFIAAFSGGILPALCQLGLSSSKAGDAGMGVAWLYFANIIGATAGSLITGFIFLEYFTLEQTMVIIAVIVFVILLGVILASSVNRNFKLKFVLPSLAALCGFLILSNTYNYKLFEHIHGLEDKNFAMIIQNRSGVITIKPDPKSDVIYGGGVYDGRFNINPVNNSNKILRAYMIAALHPNPERVLEIGLSSGSWAKVVSMYSPVKELVSVEINKGYKQAVAAYPEVSSVLTDEKVKIIVDDGRRWLIQNPDEKFDFILMNTSFFWRSNATNVLSKEFLEIAKAHMKPGGVIYYNTTGADESFYTASNVFKHVVRYGNFVAASDSPFDLDYAQKKSNLLLFKDDSGNPVFDESKPDTKKLLEKLATTDLRDIREEMFAGNDRWLITEDNMSSEYRIEYHFMPPHLYYSLFGKE